jgi:hypothetical protein
MGHRSSSLGWLTTPRNGNSLPNSKRPGRDTGPSTNEAMVALATLHRGPCRNRTQCHNYVCDPKVPVNTGTPLVVCVFPYLRYP